MNLQWDQLQPVSGIAVSWIDAVHAMCTWKCWWAVTGLPAVNCILACQQLFCCAPAPTLQTVHAPSQVVLLWSWDWLSLSSSDYGSAVGPSSAATEIISSFEGCCKLSVVIHFTDHWVEELIEVVNIVFYQETTEDAEAEEKELLNMPSLKNVMAGRNLYVHCV